MMRKFNGLLFLLLLISCSVVGEPLKSFFDEERVVQRTSVIELKSIYGLDPLRDIWTAGVTNDGSQYSVTASSGGDTQVLDSAERGPYPPGQEVEPGLAGAPARVPSDGDIGRIGYYDDQDGFYVQFDVEGMDLYKRRAGTDVLVDQWGTWEGENIVRTKGGGKDEFAPLDGYVYQFPFVWYGFGPAEYTFQVKDERGGNWMKSLGITRPTGGDTSIVQPHLPLRVEAITGAGSSENFTMKVSGRQVSIVGPYNPIFRETSVEASRASIDDTAWYPILSVRRQAVKPYALTQLEEISVISDTSVRVALLEDATITNTGNWAGSVADYGSLSLLEENVDPGGTGLSGNTIKKFLLSASGQGRNLTGDKGIAARAFMIEDRNMTIAVRKITGAASGNVQVTATFREDL